LTARCSGQRLRTTVEREMLGPHEHRISTSRGNRSATNHPRARA
jgi:hypothetical protein